MYMLLSNPFSVPEKRYKMLQGMGTVEIFVKVEIFTIAVC